MIAPAPALLTVEALGKDYATAAGWAQILRGRWRGPMVRALESVDLRLAAQETVSLLGANGAGKSTLLKCIAGLILPCRGRVRLEGRDIELLGAELRRRIVYVGSDARSFSWRLSGRANLDFFAALYGLRGERARDRVSHALGLAGLAADVADRRVSTYSTGQRQRLSIARGFLAEPEVLLLDEPTSGLDPMTSAELLRYLREELAGKRRVAVMMATHSLEHARRFAARAIHLRAGLVVSDGPVDQVAAELVP